MYFSYYNSNKVSDANVSTTELIQSRRHLASKEQDFNAVEPKKQKLDEEFREKHDKQSSLKGADKLNQSKELNQEKGELQYAQE